LRKAGREWKKYAGPNGKRRIIMEGGGGNLGSWVGEAALSKTIRGKP